MSNLVQYVLVRGDLTRTLKWPSGAVMAQACHACVAVVHTYYSDPDMQAYLKDLGNMHKVVLEVSPIVINILCIRYACVTAFIHQDLFLFFITS